MALISDATTTWSIAVVLATDEIWQTRKGAVYVTTTSSPAADDGLLLQENAAVRLPAGSNVRYRKIGATEALVVREAV